MRTLDPLTFESLLVRSWIRLPLLIGADLPKQPWASLGLFTSRRSMFWLFIRVLILFVCCQMIKCNLKGVKQCTMPAGKLFSIRLWQLFYVSVNSVRKTLVQYWQRFPFTKTTIGKTYRFYFWSVVALLSVKTSIPKRLMYYSLAVLKALGPLTVLGRRY